jgi:hypothetical protein
MRSWGGRGKMIMSARVRARGEGRTGARETRHVTSHAYRFKCDPKQMGADSCGSAGSPGIGGKLEGYWEFGNGGWKEERGRGEGRSEKDRGGSRGGAGRESPEVRAVVWELLTLFRR